VTQQSVMGQGQAGLPTRNKTRAVHSEWSGDRTRAAYSERSEDRIRAVSSERTVCGGV